MKLRAAILDDDPVILALLGGVLAFRGYEVRAFSDPYLSCPLRVGQTCPRSIEGACIDVIVCDVHMPVVNGISFVERQRQKGCKCRHVALMSGMWTDSDLRRASRLGAKCFPKPFELDHVHAWLDEVEKRVSSGAAPESPGR